MKKILFCFFVMFYMLSYAQQDTVVLKDIVATDIRLDRNKTQYIQQLNDSIIIKNAPLLTEILNFNTPIFFKENGYGMVSSPSFRGTTASQTSVLWNGIKINSGFLGQADFNTISSLGYNEIDIKYGAGSVSHGSGAIGGSIHLRHNLKFNQGLKSNVLLGYASYNTLKISGNVQYSNNKFSYNINYNRNSSDNDYKVEDLNYKNYNGQFYNNTLNTNFGYKINSRNKLSVFVEGYQGQRHFSFVEETSNRTKYRNRDLRSLIQFENNMNRLNSIVRVSFLNENWKYYQKLDTQEPFSKGELSSLIAKYDGDFKIDNSKNVTLMGEFRNDNAVGKGGGISQVGQRSGNIGLAFSHKISSLFYYEFGGRKEFNSNFKSPFLFSVGTRFTPIKWYNLKINVSKNFRAPTFNDLYWEPGGNLNLKAENSVQFEVSNNIDWKGLNLGLNLYKNDIKDMIRWVPSQSGSYWTPINLESVTTKGAEVFASFTKKFHNHIFKLNNIYSYTKAINKETDKQMAYVPFHKYNGTFSHRYRNFYWYIQTLLLGQTFTTTDENPDYTIDSYKVFNLGLNYKFGSKNTFDIGFYVKNLFDKAYEAYPYRVMPPRNFGAQLRINIKNK